MTTAFTPAPVPSAASPLAERFRPTIRLRLTLLYGGLFLVAGIVLLALIYFLMRNNMPTEGKHVKFLSKPGQTQPPPEMLERMPPGTMLTSEQAQNVVGEIRKDTARETLRSLLTQGAIALMLVGAAAVGFGWLLAERALRPVHKITETARRVARGHDLGERIAYAGPRDEVKELADTFDTMLERLARSFDGQRRFVANASHELRTPLAVNRTLVDVAVRRPDATDDLKRLGESLLVVNARHERLIDGLLTLAGSENHLVGGGPLDLADVASHVLDQAGAEASGREITVHRDLDAARTTGDPVLLERLVQNLVENGIRHNHDHGELWATTRIRNGWVELVVANTGPVVPGYEMETIFEPFRRLGNERVRSDRGSGLGLSIVRATANAHHGAVSATPRLGGGLVVTVHLPAASP
ncbi:sensor histidine kinase [Spirillospora sp. CA-294931]|uniref:sensor histidine kinase n=1 Tax=Spirillospora sp. CA-294931 TaxID=3240042 RepID=UPI003D91C53E